jgi:serine/tyrosine/threonine adenylyltransferase
VNHPLPPFGSDARAALAGSPFAGLRWDRGFGQLDARFYTRLAPTPLPDPYLVAFSADAAGLIGLPACAEDHPDFAEVAIGNRIPDGADPLAAVYAGHQFGVYVPQLGDGRALLLGALPGPQGTWELQLKGAGKTPYSRMGDGRAVLRSSIREFLCSEAMHGLGIPTTRALSVAGSDHPVFREAVETAAVVIRMAPSFVRFGSFEFFYWRNRHEELRVLADHVIDGFYPECRAAGDGPGPYLALLEAVARRTARLLAQWQGAGFCHGVMNTDNMSILGLTIDYGPFGFVDAFDANHVCNHSDEHGRYAYAQQPMVAHWNLYCLGQALIPLTEDVEATQAALETFKDEFARAITAQFNAKLGLATLHDGDTALTERLLALLDAQRVDWTIFWRRLSQLRGLSGGPEHDAAVRDLFPDRAAFDAWAVDYRARLAAEASVDAERRARMNRANPKYVLRNYLAEAAIRKARGDDGARDFGETARLLACLRNPYDEQPEYEAYATLPPDWAGTLHLSCSS